MTPLQSADGVLWVPLLIKDSQRLILSSWGLLIHMTLPNIMHGFGHRVNMN